MSEAFANNRQKKAQKKPKLKPAKPRKKLTPQQREKQRKKAEERRARDAKKGNSEDEPQNPASLAPNGLASNRRLSDAECDDYLARILGGPDARVGSTRDPDTLLQNAGTPRPPGHGPGPFNNPNPNSSDRGGIIHIYGNPEGTATDAPLYAPSGGRMGPLYTHEDEYGDPDYTGRRVTYRTGLTISFVHVGASRGPGRSGSVRVGNIGGLGGEKPPGYIHTHIIFYSDFKNKVRVDPRKVFCGQ